MTEESVSATTTISASAETVFAVLADPSRHAAVDSTGRVRDSLDGQRMTGPGQIFRVAMYHENHPDGSYEMCNLVLAFEPPRVISWKPGYMSQETGKLEFGGRADSPPVHPVPAVSSRPSRQLAEPPSRDRCQLTTSPAASRGVRLAATVEDDSHAVSVAAAGIRTWYEDSWASARWRSGRRA
jgi:hypothetical protein